MREKIFLTLFCRPIICREKNTFIENIMILIFKKFLLLNRLLLDMSEKDFMTVWGDDFTSLAYIYQGRNGLGNIYVWASGDGGEEDDCNCDGYAASMWTISINSAINDGQNAHYDESCSSTLASTFSNGAKDPNTGVVSSHFGLERELASFLGWFYLRRNTLLYFTFNVLNK